MWLSNNNDRTKLINNNICTLNKVSLFYFNTLELGVIIWKGYSLKTKFWNLKK